MSDSLRLRGGQARSVWARLQLWWYTAPVVLIGLVLSVCALSAWWQWGTIGACLYVLGMVIGLWCGWPRPSSAGAPPPPPGSTSRQPS